MSATYAPVRTIDEVIDRLDAAVDAAVARGDRAAYFACLYRAVTRRVRDDIRSGRFEDGARMERLDVVFAGRYLEALHEHRRGAPTTASWRASFEADRAGRLAILQHLLLGMNAHINLDLGIAAAQVAPGATLPALRRDFDEISRLLGEMLGDVQARLARVSPWLGILDTVGGRSDEEVCSFCLSGSRDLAWRWAERFARATPAVMSMEISALDRLVTTMSLPIRRPTPMVATALAVVRARESGDVRRVAQALS